MAQPTSKMDFNQIGVVGLRESGGRIQEEFLRDLHGERGQQVYKEMSENDEIVGAVLFAIDMLIRQVDWKVQEASQEEEDIAAATFLEQCMDDMSHSWKDMISEILSMLVFGWSWHEIVYKRRVGPDESDPTKRSKYTDGLIGWRKLPTRAQETLYQWHMSDDGGIMAMEQYDTFKGIQATIPIEKSLHFVTRRRKNNPEGRSILRTAYRSWYFKKNIQNIEGIGIERDLAGLPVIWCPPSLLDCAANENDKQVLQTLKKIVTSIKRDEQEGIIMPMAYDENNNKLFDLQLLSSGGSRQFNTSEIVSRYNQGIAMSVLADFILLGHEKVGSFALASSKTHLFSVAIGAWLDSIADTFNRYAVPRLFKLNNFKTNVDLPKLVHGDVESVDLAELGSFIGALSGAGVELFPDTNLENHLRKQAGLPMSNTDQEAF